MEDDESSWVVGSKNQISFILGSWGDFFGWESLNGLIL